MHLLLFTLVLLSIQNGDDVAAPGDFVTLNSLTQSEVDLVVVAELEGPSEGRCRVVVEASINGTDFLPVANLEVTGAGRKVASTTVGRLYSHVRARLELRGDAQIKQLTATLASSVPLMREGDAAATPTKRGARKSQSNVEETAPTLEGETRA